MKPDGEICDPPNTWDIGCCTAYDAQKCEEVCFNDPPTVNGHTECAIFGNDGWCVEGGQLHMSGSDPDGDPITISGTMVGQAFTCPQGNSCIFELVEGNGAAIFHAYDGELSSGNFSVAYKYDATPPALAPAVTGTAGTNGWYISYVSVATGATDPASGVMMSKIRLFSGGWEDSLDFNADGIYNIEMSALDNAGNESVQQAQIMVDTVDPVYDVLVGGTPGINDWYRSDVNWQAAATDATSGMASIEVNMDAAGWTVANTASFSAEGPHTVDFRFTDVAGNNVSTSHAFSIDKTPPTITMNTPTEGQVVSRNVAVGGTAADTLSGLMEVAVSPDGGYTWHIIPWQPDGSWQYDWDTTSGPNGVFALIARATDEAGNVTTDQVNVIVDNAPPTVSITESWDLWDTARGSVHSNIIPVGSIHLTVECGDQPDRTYDYNANTNTFDFKWDRRCGDGNLAPSGTYTVVLEACDIYNNCDEARGKVEIPFVAAIPPTATPMPTIENTQVVQQWYTNPTAVPSTTPTPQAQQDLPVLPMTGNGESGDRNLPSGNNQPLLPLAAAALGTSVLLAASSRREEETANAPAAAETTYVEAASLSSIAGVVKETFTGVWEDAVRISAADPRRVTTTHTGSIDMDEYNRKLAGWVIASEQAYKEIAKEKEEKRQEAIQWLADNKARTDEAARVAKEQEIAETIAAQKAAALYKKMTRDEEYTEDKNVFQMDYAEMMKKFHEKESQDIETYKEQQWNEKFNSFTVPDYMKTSYLGTGPSAESVFTPDEELQEVIDANIAKQVEGGTANKWFEKIADYFSKDNNQVKAGNTIVVPDYMNTANEPVNTNSVFTPDAELQDVIDASIAKQVEDGASNNWIADILNKASAGLGILHDKVGEPIEDYYESHKDVEIKKENSGPVSQFLPNAPGSFIITHDGNPFGGYSIEQVPPNSPDNGEAINNLFSKLGNGLNSFLYNWYIHPDRWAELKGNGPDLNGLDFVSENANVIKDTNTSSYVSDIALGAGFAAESEHMGNIIDFLQGLRNNEHDASGPGGFTNSQIDNMKKNDYDNDLYEADRFLFTANSDDPNDPLVATQAMIVRIENNLAYKGVNEICTGNDKFIISLMSHNVGFNVADVINDYVKLGNDGKTNIDWDSYYNDYDQLNFSENPGLEERISTSFNNWRAGDQNYNTQFMLKLAVHDVDILLQTGWELPGDVDIELIRDIANR